MNKRQIFKTIKSLEGFNKSIEHDSFEKSKKNADKPFQKYEFLGDRVLGLIISEYLTKLFDNDCGAKTKQCKDGARVISSS